MEKVNIIFDPVAHKYVDNHGNPYTSVTQLIGKFEPKFNEKYWAEFKARERGVPVSQILMEWELIRNNSCERGTATHEFLEDNVNGIYDNTTVEFNTIVERSQSSSYKYKITNVEQMYFLPIREKLPEIFYRLLTYVKDGWVLYAEARTYSVKYRIAGTIDLLLVRGKDIMIIDWKTNKDDLKFTSGYYKKEMQVIDGVNVKVKTNKWISKQEYLDYPLNNIMKCKGMTYTLQLSLYAYLIEAFGFTAKKLELFHIVNNEYDRLKAYKIEYLKQDVQRMLDFHLKQNNIPTTKNKFSIQ
jgi:hypothetical protein